MLCSLGRRVPKSEEDWACLRLGRGRRSSRVVVERTRCRPLLSGGSSASAEGYERRWDVGDTVAGILEHGQSTGGTRGRRVGVQSTGWPGAWGRPASAGPAVRGAPSGSDGGRLGFDLKEEGFLGEDGGEGFISLVQAAAACAQSMFRFCLHMLAQRSSGPPLPTLSHHPARETYGYRPP